jgi:uncharacterized membrane protein
MSEESTNSRLEAFCDAVFAIALTLLILDIKAPGAANIQTSQDLWLALKHLLPSAFAFLLSFTIIIVMWVNHHSFMKAIHKSTPAFLYANIFLLLTVVIIPFPTNLLAEFCFTKAAAPAVVLYSLTILLTNIGWIIVTRAALLPKSLARNESAKALINQMSRQGQMAFFLYLACAILAFWLPVLVAVVISLTFLIWLILGLYYKHEVQPGHT